MPIVYQPVKVFSICIFFILEQYGPEVVMWNETEKNAFPRSFPLCYNANKDLYNAFLKIYSEYFT